MYYYLGICQNICGDRGFGKQVVTSWMSSLSYFHLSNERKIVPVLLLWWEHFYKYSVCVCVSVCTVVFVCCLWRCLYMCLCVCFNWCNVWMDVCVEICKWECEWIVIMEITISYFRAMNFVLTMTACIVESITNAKKNWNITYIMNVKKSQRGIGSA